MRARSFGKHYRGSGWNFQLPSDNIVDLGLVPVQGLVLDFSASTDFDSTDVERATPLVAAAHAAVEQQQWADHPNRRILLIEWYSDVVLAGLPRQFEARDIRDATSKSVTSDGPGALSRKHFIEKFAVDVAGLSALEFARIDQRHLDLTSRERGHDLTLTALEGTIAEYLGRFEELISEPFPSDILHQIDHILGLILNRWISQSRAHKTEESWLSVSIRQQFDKCSASMSGAGYLYTRHPNTARREIYVEFSPGRSLAELNAGIAPTIQPEESYGHLATVIRHLKETLVAKSSQPWRLSFVVLESGIFIDSVVALMPGARGRVQMAADDCRDRHDHWRESLTAVLPNDLSEQLSPRLAACDQTRLIQIGSGFGVAPGVCIGVLSCHQERLEAVIKDGLPVIFAANSPGPEQVTALFTSSGAVFATGGSTSHVAVIARGAGLPCVLGVSDLSVNAQEGVASFGSMVVREGDWITVDGTSGNVYLGKGNLISPSDTDEKDLHELLKWCDSLSHLAVYANADIAAEAESAYRLGAKGIGLCRLEHVLLRPERLRTLQRAMVLAFACGELTDQLFLASRRVALYGTSRGAAEQLKETEQRSSTSPEYQAYISELHNLEEMLTEALSSLMAVSHDKSIVVRLLDPPLSEFLSEDTARAIMQDLSISPSLVRSLLTLIKDPNPMLGIRGIRLCHRAPEFTRTQLRAILRAAALVVPNGAPTSIDIMVPFVSDSREVAALRPILDDVAKSVLARTRSTVAYRLGTMIETPRAALLAGDLARVSDFLSFGTNDLTQFTWACPRDLAEGELFSKGVYSDACFRPFTVFDDVGIGALMRMAVTAARQVAPAIQIGVCGEYGGDPDAIKFFSHIGVNYVSCSPFRVPIARLVSGQLAALKDISNG